MMDIEVPAHEVTILQIAGDAKIAVNRGFTFIHFRLL